MHASKPVGLLCTLLRQPTQQAVNNQKSDTCGEEVIEGKVLRAELEHNFMVFFAPIPVVLIPSVEQ
jgi:hypothetical protein